MRRRLSGKRLQRRGGALFRRVRRERDGAAAVEFAVAFPVLMILLMGIYDVGHTAYIYAVMNGALQKAARDGTLETGQIAREDAYIEATIHDVIPSAVINVERLSYFDFNDIARPESWNDANGDGTCNNGENYTDENGNGVWDADVGLEGRGGANDVVLYEVSVSYEPVFAIPFTTGSNGARNLTATAVKKNQPYANQDGYGSSAGTCT